MKLKCSVQPQMASNLFLKESMTNPAAGNIFNEKNIATDEKATPKKSIILNSREALLWYRSEDD